MAFQQDTNQSKKPANLRLRNFRFPTREDAFKKLHQAYSVTARAPKILSASTERSSDIVILSGVSGTGKSTLVKQFLSDLRTKAHTQTEAQGAGGGTVYPYVLKGKYDESAKGSRPLSGIIDALSGLAHTLELEGTGWDDQKETTRLQEAIHNKLGDEASFLATIVPELTELVGASHVESRSRVEEEDALSNGNDWNRLRYIFQAFTAAISTEERPVILILDDLQWMDNASLELLQSLLCDQSLKHFMFIGLYRAEEVSPEDQLPAALDNIKKSIDITEIELYNLDLPEMTAFLSKTLLNKDVDKANVSADTRESVALAKSIFDKTQGNIFFALQILDDLQRKEILKYSQCDASWTWSQDPTQVIDRLSIDLEDILKEKITSASPLLQQILTMMAYTRSSIDVRTLRELMLKNGWGISIEQLFAELKVGKAADLLTNKEGSPFYTFAHDHIQQAGKSATMSMASVLFESTSLQPLVAYELVPSGKERTQFRVDMGLRLVNMYETSKRDWLLFAGADHLNATADQKTAESNFLLKINIQAGERAQSVAAFDAASDFLGRAVNIVETQPNPWQASYKSTLCLYQNLAATEFCQGRMDAGNRLANVVLKTAIGVDDKVPTMIVMAKALGVEQKHKESVALCYKTLNLMKMYPKSTLGVNGRFLHDIATVLGFWKRTTNEQILTLPTLRDKRKVAALEILGNAAINSLAMGNPLSFLRATFRSLRLSFQHGLSPYSMGAITSFMIIRVNMEDFEGAKRVALLAQSVSKRFKVNAAISCQLLFVTYFVSGWHDPQLKVINDLEKGYKAGMACGDHELAGINGLGYCSFQFLSGYPLSLVEHRLGRLVMELTAHNVHSTLPIAQQTRLATQILQGNLAFDFHSLSTFGPTQEDKSVRTELSYGYIYRMMLGVFFGRYDLSEAMLIKLKKLSGEDKAVPAVSLSSLHATLMHLSLYHDGGHKRNRSRAKPYIQAIESVANGLGTNSLHRLMIMKAHANASKHTALSAVKQGYDEAVEHSVKTGHIQDAGLACQMAAQYLSSRVAQGKVSDTTDSVRLDTAGVYLKKAVKYYRRWGADGLAHHLQLQHTNGSISTSSTCTASCSKHSETTREECKDLQEPTLFDF